MEIKKEELLDKLLQDIELDLKKKKDKEIEKSIYSTLFADTKNPKENRNDFKRRVLIDRKSGVIDKLLEVMEAYGYEIVKK
ncbi:MAG: hypothetical protein ACI86H_002673 [bacterium]|jgi:hypothetical protein